MENVKEKDGLIAFDYESETAKTTYDKVIAKADVLISGHNAKGIFRLYYNGAELPQEQREFNLKIDRHGDIFGQVYAVGRQKMANFTDHYIDEEGRTLNVKPEPIEVVSENG